MSLKNTCRGLCAHSYKDRYVSGKSYIRIDLHVIRLQQDLGAKYCKTCCFYTFKADGEKRCKCCHAILSEDKLKHINIWKNLLERQHKEDRLMIGYPSYRALAHDYIK